MWYWDLGLRFGLGNGLSNWVLEIRIGDVDLEMGIGIRIVIGDRD